MLTAVLIVTTAYNGLTTGQKYSVPLVKTGVFESATINNGQQRNQQHEWIASPVVGAGGLIGPRNKQRYDGQVQITM